jgi:hypothetical protein
MSELQTEAVESTSAELWDGWHIVESVDEIIECAGVEIHRAGLTAQGPGGRTAVGSAADLRESPMVRAMHELMERAGLLEVVTASPAELPCLGIYREAVGTVTGDAAFPPSPEPARWQYSRSNGVAAAPSWAAACRAAAFEAIERERILSSWYGVGPAPREIKPGKVFAEDIYDWKVVSIPGPIGAPEVVFAVAFPRRPDAPLLRGAGCAWSVADARAHAVGECLQSLAFLWGEDIPTEEPESAPSPMFHLDYYLWRQTHMTLRRWLGSGAEPDAAGPLDRHGISVHRLSFIDLTPAAVAGRLHVVKACLPDAIPLVFGDHCPIEDVPPERRVHPMP